ncbi:MAG TPA: hypothetical protein VHX38_34250 [Pseudonocardiaceae bacterium]|nr:hypothetical protein [Pseudonocardiaceae bacterium]
MTDKTMPTDEEVAEVRALLAEARLPASETEIRTLAMTHRAQRAAVDELYTAPVARYVDPALRFRAQARIIDWSTTA